MAATVNVKLVTFNNTDTHHRVNPQAPGSAGIGTGEILTTSGASAQATLTANSATLGEVPVGRAMWRIAVVGAAATDLVYVTFGSNPTATNAGFLVPSGSVAYFGVGAVSEKVAVLGPA